MYKNINTKLNNNFHFKKYINNKLYKILEIYVHILYVQLSMNEIIE